LSDIVQWYVVGEHPRQVVFPVPFALKNPLVMNLHVAEGRTVSRPRADSCERVELWHRHVRGLSGLEASADRGIQTSTSGDPFRSDASGAAPPHCATAPVPTRCTSPPGRSAVCHC